MITASIVAYHTPINELSHFLECIVHSNIDVLYLVDNSSNDSLRELSSMSRKIVYIYSDNLGFGHGHNIAIQKSIAVNADYHIVINPDMLLGRKGNRGIAGIYESSSRLWLGDAQSALPHWRNSISL